MVEEDRIQGKRGMDQKMHESNINNYRAQFSGGKILQHAIYGEMGKNGMVLRII